MSGLYDDGNIQTGLAHPCEHAQAVEIWHHQIEHYAVDAWSLRPDQQRNCGVATFGNHRLIAETLNHGFE